MGYNLDVDDSYGRTLLCLAVDNGHEGVVKILLLTDAVNINTEDSQYWRTPLGIVGGRKRAPRGS